MLDPSALALTLALALGEQANEQSLQGLQQEVRVAAQHRASREAKRRELVAPAPRRHANNLDGWIRESLDVMRSKGIPGSYEGIKRNILRESGGNPRAVNRWDVNAQNGTPSQGLLQMIGPTFRAYHVPGTSWDPFDPVANITAACKYAAARYGSMDNVNGAY